MELLIKIGITVVISLIVWLPIAISLYLENRQFIKESDKDFYILRQPRFVLGLGVLSTVIFFILFILAVFVSNQWIGLSFLPFCVLGMFLAIYSIRWKIIVKGNCLEISQFSKSLIEIDIHDIEQVVQDYNGITAYMDKKKLFTMENWVVGYKLLYNRLHELGKMESTQSKKTFRVRRSKAEPVVGILSTIIFTGFLICAVIKPNETAIPFVYIIFIGFILFGIYFTIASLRWKLLVTGDLLICRSPLGREKVLPIRNIEKAQVKKNAILLICNGKAIIKVEPVYKGYSILVERLRSEQVPFYNKNKLIEFKL